ncbi:MAG TPA: TaqI-like C-terminal specificity domain-containing protein, partial [Bacteroidales bacterium]|nr:TaqI-like C-terminal specificity domain-containing protein [Bacteroidales bacterium]
IKEKLIEEDAKSADLIKPILRGRDIKKYLCDFGDLWLLNVHNGVKEKGVPPVNIDKYPAIKKHLDKYITKLTKRADKGISLYHLRNCAYIEDFNKEKIVYPNMTKFLPFTLDLDGHYLNDKCFILSGEKLYYLVAFLNSKLFRFCFSDAFPELQGNSKEIKKFILETIPVIEISDEEPFRNKVIEIIDMKKGGENSYTTNLEAEIDQMIYKLYNLTEEEIEIIEAS